MTPDDDFESFRGTLSHLDSEAEQRIRRRFEQLRDRGSAAPTPNDVSSDDTEIVELEPVTATDDVSPRHTRRVLMGMAAAVALLALIGIVTLVRNADDTADVASGVDGVPLTELANRAANQPDVDLLPGQYLYRSSIEGASFDAIDAGSRPARASSCSSCGSIATERACVGSTNRDGPRPHRVRPKVPSPPSLADIQVRPAQPFFNPSLTYAELRSLPTDPDALDAAARRTSGDPSDPAFEAQTLSWWLAIETTPPAVRAAAFEALAQLGAEPIGSVTTYNGQDGFGYQGAGEGGAPWIIVIDAASTRVLAFARGAGAGDALWTDATRFDEYGDQWVVDALPS